MEQDRRLDRAELLAVVERADPGPGPAQVGRPFEVDAPAPVLGAGGAQQRAVGEHDRLVLDRAEDTLGEPARPRPGPAAVVRRREHPPPRARATGRPCRRAAAAPSPSAPAGTGPGSSRGTAGRPPACRRRPRPVPSSAPTTRRATQMPTSSAPSLVPPNQAATRPPGVSAIVEAWHDANGGLLEDELARGHARGLRPRQPTRGDPEDQRASHPAFAHDPLPSFRSGGPGTRAYRRSTDPLLERLVLLAQHGRGDLELQDLVGALVDAADARRP